MTDRRHEDEVRRTVRDVLEDGTRWETTGAFIGTIRGLKLDDDSSGETLYAYDREFSEGADQIALEHAREGGSYWEYLSADPDLHPNLRAPGFDPAANAALLEELRQRAGRTEAVA